MQAYAHRDDGASSCENHFSTAGVDDDDILDGALDIAEDLQISACVGRGVEHELSRLKERKGDGCSGNSV